MDRHELFLTKIREMVLEEYKDDCVLQVFFDIEVTKSTSLIVIEKYKKNENGVPYVEDDDVVRETIISRLNHKSIEV